MPNDNGIGELLPILICDYCGIEVERRKRIFVASENGNELKLRVQRSQTDIGGNEKTFGSVPCAKMWLLKMWFPKVLAGTSEGCQENLGGAA